MRTVGMRTTLAMAIALLAVVCLAAPASADQQIYSTSTDTTWQVPAGG